MLFLPCDKIWLMVVAHVTHPLHGALSRLHLFLNEGFYKKKSDRWRCPEHWFYFDALC